MVGDEDVFGAQFAVDEAVAGAWAYGVGAGVQELVEAFSVRAQAWGQVGGLVQVGQGSCENGLFAGGVGRGCVLGQLGGAAEVGVGVGVQGVELVA
ncbi:hypothetical protein [Nocardiopsis kunsanensis]|uniref:hypothetical protein n=1 Tax=Nocardiopsis kunsanensis TaxID=141693 RepID=UPI0012693FA6|nr:hypothetical protein [Nocardiopsis kunsanensis]